MSEVIFLSEEEFQRLLEAARAKDRAMADKVMQQQERGIVLMSECVVKLAEIAGWV